MLLAGDDTAGVCGRGYSKKLNKPQNITIWLDAAAVYPDGHQVIHHVLAWGVCGVVQEI